MRDMAYREMVDAMQMDDTARVGKVSIDRFETRGAGGDDAYLWDTQSWYGGDYNKVFLKFEGERVAGVTENARVDLLLDRIAARFWNLQLGLREDFGSGPARTWTAMGIEGLAPYWFEFDATLYVGDAGRTAVRVKMGYDVLFTQRLVLRGEAEANYYGKADRERRIGAGLANTDLGVRLRYEIRRELAPYVGVAWQRKFGDTAAYSRSSGFTSPDLQFVAGLRIWF